VNADYKILLVDDDENLLWAYKMILSDEGFKVCTSTDPEEALEKIKSERFNVLVIDYMMPKMRGDELANMILTLDESSNIIFLTGYSEYAVYMKMVGNMDNLILYKPISGKELINAVNSKIRQAQSVVDNVHDTNEHTVNYTIHPVK
jgi:DNA-binding response OmpR family regulator